MQLSSTIEGLEAVAGDRPRTHRAAALLRYRELLWMLAWRDIRVRYKHSLLGAAWAVLPPLLMVGIFTFVFGTINQINPAGLTGHATLPYSLFAFAGLVPWTFFANGLSAATISLVSNRQLVTKIYFPREVFPFAAIISAFVDFVIASGVLVAYALYLHVMSGTWRYEVHASIIFLPVVVAVQIVLMTGLSLILSMANLFYRDVGFLFRSIIQVWMFFTCVLYQLEATAGWKRIAIQLNPMTPIIRAYRDCLILGRNPFDVPFAWACLSAAAALLVGWKWFGRRECRFAECI
jgi:lipopolysaccharide transport system permease protein